MVSNGCIMVMDGFQWFTMVMVVVFNGYWWLVIFMDVFSNGCTVEPLLTTTPDRRPLSL